MSVSLILAILGVYRRNSMFMDLADVWKKLVPWQ